MHNDSHHSCDVVRVAIEVHVLAIFDLSKLTEMEAWIQEYVPGLLYDVHESIGLSVPTSLSVSIFEWYVVTPHLFVARSYPYNLSEGEQLEVVADLFCGGNFFGFKDSTPSRHPRVMSFKQPMMMRLL